MKRYGNEIQVNTLDTVVFIEKAKYERQLDAVRRIGSTVTEIDYQMLEEFDNWQKVIDSLGSLVNGDEQRETLDILIDHAYSILKINPSLSAKKIVASMLHDKFSRIRESMLA